MLSPLRATWQDRGAFGKNALHGYLYRKPMAVLAASGGEDHATLSLGYDFDGADAGYPFLLRAEITYSLRAGGRFDVAVRAENRDAAGGWPLPFYNGWHPYFLVSDVSAVGDSGAVCVCPRHCHCRGGEAAAAAAYPSSGTSN